MKTNRALIVGVIAVLFVTVVVPCLFAEPQAEEMGPAKLTFWAISDPPKNEYIQELINKFQEENPGTEITYESFSARDYNNKLMVALVGKTGPDIFDNREATTPTLVLKDLVVPADNKALGYSSQSALEKDYITLQPFSYHNKVYGLPFSINVYSTFLNAKHFREAGLNADTNPPTNWEELLEIATKLTLREGERITVEGYGLPYGLNPGWYMAEFSAPLYQRGGSFLSDNDTGTVATINSKAGQETLDYWYELANVAEASNLHRADPHYDSYVFEKTSMLTVGGFLVQRVANKNPELSPEVRVVVVPQVPGGNPTVMVTGWGWFVNSGCQFQKTAWKFIGFAAKDPGAWLEAAGFLVPKTNLMDTPEGREYPYMQVFLDGMKWGRPRLPHPNYSEIADIMKRAIDRALTKQAPVEESLNLAKEEIEKALP